MARRNPYRFAGIITLCAGILLCVLGLWLVLAPAEYSATAAIDVVETTDLVEAFMKRHPHTAIYTLCLAGQEVELIRTDEKILAAALRKAGPDRSLGFLRRHLRFHWPGCQRIEITVTDCSADKAAAMANAIAETYQDARARKLQASSEKELRALKTQLALLANSAPDNNQSLLEMKIAQAEVN